MGRYIVSAQIAHDVSFTFEASDEDDAWAKAALELAREARRWPGGKTLKRWLFYDVPVPRLEDAA